MAWRMPHNLGEVRRLAVPIILSNITVPLIGVVDTAVVGHLAEPRYLAAVAIGGLIFSFVFWSFGFLRQGTTGSVAQAHGREDGVEIRAILARALGLAVLIGLILIVLQDPIKTVALKLIGASGDVTAQAELYFTIRIWSAPGALMQYALMGWLVGMQDTRSLMWIQILVNGINIVLDLLFVLGFGWGVAGVAAATLIAELGGAVFALYLVGRKLRGVCGGWSRQSLRNWAAMKRLLMINSDIMIRSLCLQAVFLVFTAQAAQYGDVVLAANAVLMNFLTVAAFALDGFAHAAEALVGKSVGSRNRAAFQEAVFGSTMLAGAVAIVITVAYALLGPVVIFALTGLDEVRQAALSFLPWLIAMPLVSVWSYQMDGVYFGATATREVRNMMILCFGVFLASIWLIPPSFGNHGLWLALTVFNGARGVSLVWRLAKMRDRCTD